MKTTIKIGIFVLMMLWASTAKAQLMGGMAGHTASMCERVANTTDKLSPPNEKDSYCIALFSGWRTVIDRFPVLTPSHEYQVHISSTAPLSQLIRVYCNYVKAHPEYERKDEFLVFVWALQDAGLWTENKFEK